MKLYFKEDISKIIQEILDTKDDSDKDEWFTTDRNFTSYGLEMLEDVLSLKELEKGQ